MWTLAFSVSRHASEELVRYNMYYIESEERPLRKSFKRLKVTRPR